MKTKHADRQNSPPEEFPDRASQSKKKPGSEDAHGRDTANKKKDSEPDYDVVRRSLSRGYYPDGPGGNYKGV